MVSTRGVKVKFLEGERVLCYEPDPTKAKVLYDSKVLDVLVKKDSRGKKFVEYMIHFQGWNSSWDRSVSEEYVLKDTPENRQLQRDLAEKSQLHIGAYLYRKERKKHKGSSGGKPSDPRATQSSEDGSCGSPTTLMEEEEANALSSSSDDDSSIEDDVVPIELTPFLKEHLEADYYNIKTKNKLHKLPYEHNVVAILEEYWRYYATKLFSSLSEKPNNRNRHSYNNGVKIKPEDIQRKLVLCKEVLDGIRTFFDFTLTDLLLYIPERNQIATAPTKATPPVTSPKLETSAAKNEVEDQEYAHIPVVVDDDSFQSDLDRSLDASGRSTRRRTLRSNKSCDSNGAAAGDGPSKTRNSTSAQNHGEVNGLTFKIPNWKAVPEIAYTQNPPPPCLVYGITHLLRLFVKMPELLSTSTLPDEKMKIVLENCEDFLNYLTDKKELYHDVIYVDVA